jgi:nicotinamide mononucleotide (NMN) deamidase PncC
VLVRQCFSLQEVADQIYYRPDIAVSDSLVTGPEGALDSCPPGTNVHVEPPTEMTEGAEGPILRTGAPR